MSNGLFELKELSDDIPYKKIKSLTIKSVEFNNGAYEIRFELKLEGVPEEKSVPIIRKDSDFEWLVKKIEEECPSVFILPSVLDTNQSFLSLITNKFSDEYKVEYKSKADQDLKEKAIERFFNIIIEVSLESIYQIPTFKESSLYTFFDQSYELYKLERYQKKRTAETSKGLFSWMMSGLGMTKAPSILYLKEEIERYVLLEESIKTFMTEVFKVEESLDGLRKSFLKEQGKFMSTKEQSIYQMFVQFENIYRLIEYAIKEMKEVNRKIEDKKSQLEEDQIKKSLSMYKKYLLKEEERLTKETGVLKEEFYELVFMKTIDVKVSDLVRVSYN